IAVRPVALVVTPALPQTTSQGSVVLPVRAGFAGTLTAAAFGPVTGEVTTNHLIGEQQRFDRANPAAGPAVAKVTVTVPAGSRAARFATFAAEHAPKADLDAFVYRAGTSTLVTTSAGATA